MEGRLGGNCCTTSSGTSYLQRELTLSQTCACVTALRSGVYVACVCVHVHVCVCLCVEATRCILQTLFWYIMKLCAFLYKAHIISLYAKTIELSKNVLSKTITSRFDKRSSETRGLTSNITTYNSMHFYNLTSL